MEGLTLGWSREIMTVWCLGSRGTLSDHKGTHSGSQPGRFRTVGLSSQVLAAGLHISEEEEGEEENELLLGALGSPSQMSAQVPWPRLLFTYQLLHSLELILSRAVRDLLLLSQAGNSAQVLGCPTWMAPGPMWVVSSPFPSPVWPLRQEPGPTGQPPA